MISQDYSIIDVVYPVGSIYINATTANPATLFPGTEWERIPGRFLLGSNAAHPVGSTGGHESHTLTVDELAPHSHEPSVHGDNWVPNVDYQRTQVATSSSSGRYALTTGAQGDYTWGESGTTGGGESIDMFPPYLSVNIWKRTA